MKDNKKYNKENIKDRMFKNAAGFWGVRNVENLDPVVRLMIESLASEIYKLSGEVNNIEIRILERIAHLLTPDILMTARPAHMILHAQPLESQGMVSRSTGFFYDDPVFNLKHKLKVGFYPVDSFPLIKGRVKSLICGRNIYTLDKYQNKEIFTRSMVRTDKFARNIWIGLDVDKEIKSIRNLSLYFDFINMDNRNEYLHLLPFTQWEHSGEPVRMKEGIHSVDAGPDQRKKYLFSGYDLANVSDESIRQFYNYQFITIDEEIKNDPLKYKKVPDEVLELFEEEHINRMEDALLWLKVTFPPNFNESILENTRVTINVFPVANKSLRTQQSRQKKLTNTIPLPTDEKEYFLSVNTVIDSQNQSYEQLPFHYENVYGHGTYSVKKGGAERFDSRDAREYISNLIDLLREEGVSFSLIGKGFLNEFVQNVEILITAMERKVLEINKSNREIPSYLVLDSEEEGETIYVDYWVTNCEIVNDIKAGAFFASYNETLVDTDQIFSLTHTTGGRRTPKSSAVLDMYKYILTSRDRIYTNDDIISFCYSEFGDIISLAEVKKGVQVSTKPKEGLIRTIDVFICMKNGFEHASSDLEIKDRLLNLLKEKSPDTFNYRVFIS